MQATMSWQTCLLMDVILYNSIASGLSSKYEFDRDWNDFNVISR